MGTSIEVNVKKGVLEATGMYDFGDNLEECVSIFGEEVVFTNARANMKITLQAGMRRCLEKNKEVDSFITQFKPGVQTTGGQIDIRAAIKAKFSTMSEEERNVFLADIRDMDSENGPEVV